LSTSSIASICALLFTTFCFSDLVCVLSIEP
jgi:hypothetical protein